MLGYPISKSDFKYINKVNFIKEEYMDTVINIYINVNMTYGGLDENFLIAKIFKDYKVQGCRTYFKGNLKDYKTVKPTLNAINKFAFKHDILGIADDKILIFTGLKKDIKDTRMYKRLVKEKQSKKLNQKETTLNTQQIQDSNNNTVTDLHKDESTTQIINNDISTNNTVTTTKQDTIISSTKVSQTPIISDNYTLLKDANNVQIYGTKQDYTSHIFNETYKIINDIQIVKNNTVIYKVNNICFPINVQDKININDHLDEIILYINNVDQDMYWTQIRLDALLKEKK